MATDTERAELAEELRSLDEQVERLRAEVQVLGDDLREPDEAAAARIAVEQLLLVDKLERRRDELRLKLDQQATAAHRPAPARSGNAELLDPYDDEDLRESLAGMPATFPHKGRGEEVDPAVWPEEWTGPRSDQMTEAVDADDPVEALEIGALSAATEGGPFADTTELADRAAPPAPEEAALTERVRTPSDVDHLSVGLPPRLDLDELDEASLEDLMEAELVAIDEGDPEAAAIILDEIEQRRRRK